MSCRKTYGVITSVVAGGLFASARFGLFGYQHTHIFNKDFDTVEYSLTKYYLYDKIDVVFKNNEPKEIKEIFIASERCIYRKVLPIIITTRGNVVKKQTNTNLNLIHSFLDMKSIIQELLEEW